MRWIRVLMAGLIGACAAGMAVAAPRIEMGVLDPLSLDQPRVSIELRDPASGELIGPSQLLLPSFVLDTGANGVVFAVSAYFDDNLFDYNPDLYAVSRRPGDCASHPLGCDVQYRETGIGGEAPLFDVLVPYEMTILDAFGLPTATVDDPVRALGRFELDLGGFAGIVGMPVMRGRVTTFDLTPMSPLGFIEVTMSDTRPAAVATSYHVNLSRLTHHVEAGQLDPADPPPTFADLPLIEGVRARHDGQSATGVFLLDTGAQTPIILASLADAMGIDPVRDAIDYVPIGGIGGEILAPLVAIDAICLPTAEGFDIVYRDIQAVVLDIEGLEVDGILTMPFLTTGYLDALFTDNDGQVLRVVLDFTEGGGDVMRLDMNPALHQLSIPGDLNGDLVVNITDLSVLARFFGRAAGASTEMGDVDEDGDVDIGDLAQLAAHFNTDFRGAAASSVPEPAAAAVAITLVTLVRTRSGRRIRRRSVTRLR